MSIFTQPMMTNLQPQPTAASALRNASTGHLHDLRKVALAVVGALGMAFAAALFATASGVNGADPNASTVRIGSASTYHDARVLEPGSRGSVVDV